MLCESCIKQAAFYYLIAMIVHTYSVFIEHMDANLLTFSKPLLQATKVADEMADESTKAGTSSPDKVYQYCFH